MKIKTIITFFLVSLILFSCTEKEYHPTEGDTYYEFTYVNEKGDILTSKFYGKYIEYTCYGNLTRISENTLVPTNSIILVKILKF